MVALAALDGRSRVEDGHADPVDHQDGGAWLEHLELEPLRRLEDQRAVEEHVR